ncbi:hypothetical protein [Mycolicibacterium hodleri]|uniref:Uncharacterized protein n=1 Tax=Mycolicibacterium hodleri TaxID=49897 RepID=A0A502E7Q0_9MYCO|nr:hypothetical protein [Mycolicibacterium hodleri]TPG33673.1 hypothetical protein EAH80_15575 [Mycolicibacterium hodleri]
MFGFLRDRASLSGLPTELRQQLDADDVIVIAERVGVVQHLRGHVPGVVSSSSASRSHGAFALTTTRAVATFPTGGDPLLRAIDSRWDLPRGPARVTIGEKGMKIDIALRGVDPSFSGSMTLNYKRAIAGVLLDRMPATQLWCSVDPVFVYRAAGVRPRP